MKSYVLFQNKSRFILILVLILFVVQIILTLSLRIPNVKGATEQPVCTYFYSIQIQRGDNLWTIAQTYKPKGENIYSYIERIKKLNQIKSNRIYAGDHLIILIEKKDSY